VNIITKVSIPNVIPVANDTLLLMILYPQQQKNI